MFHQQSCMFMSSRVQKNEYLECLTITEYRTPISPKTSRPSVCDTSPRTEGRSAAFLSGENREKNQPKANETSRSVVMAMGNTASVVAWRGCLSACLLWVQIVQWIIVVVDDDDDDGRFESWGHEDPSERVEADLNRKIVFFFVVAFPMWLVAVRWTEDSETRIEMDAKR